MSNTIQVTQMKDEQFGTIRNQFESGVDSWGSDKCPPMKYFFVGW